MTILLIDGDERLWRACAATEREVKWDDQNHVLASNEEEAWETVKGSIEKVLHHFNTKEHAVTLSAGRNFRLDIDPTYKGNRAKTRKPLCYWDVRERLKTEFNCVAFDGLEADDVMGILATKPGRTERIIVARDKDMKTIPGKLWDGSKFHVISEEQADHWHLYQTLIGDTADGYKGCPGCGPKKAEAILAEGEGTPWQRLVAAYTKAGLTEQDALRQARLARILRWSDWDNVNKRPILWEPK
jgi:5'-3' exonuclease